MRGLRSRRRIRRTDDDIGSTAEAGRRGNLRESESKGGIVALEYLFVGTILTIGGMTTTIQQIQPVAEPATLALLGIGIAGIGFAWRRKLR